MATGSDEQYDCLQGRPTGCVDVPPYDHVPDGSITEDWDSGMIIHWYHICCNAMLSKLYSTPIFRFGSWCTSIWLPWYAICCLALLHDTWPQTVSWSAPRVIVSPDTLLTYHTILTHFCCRVSLILSRYSTRFQRGLFLSCTSVCSALFIGSLCCSAQCSWYGLQFCNLPQYL